MMFSRARLSLSPRNGTKLMLTHSLSTDGLKAPAENTISLHLSYITQNIILTRLIQYFTLSSINARIIGCSEAVSLPQPEPLE